MDGNNETTSALSGQQDPGEMEPQVEETNSVF